MIRPLLALLLATSALAQNTSEHMYVLRLLAQPQWNAIAHKCLGGEDGIRHTDEWTATVDCLQRSSSGAVLGLQQTPRLAQSILRARVTPQTTSTQAGTAPTSGLPRAVRGGRDYRFPLCPTKDCVVVVDDVTVPEGQTYTITWQNAADQNTFLGISGDPVSGQAPIPFKALDGSDYQDSSATRYAEITLRQPVTDLLIGVPLMFAPVVAGPSAGWWIGITNENYGLSDPPPIFPVLIPPSILPPPPPPLCTGVVPKYDIAIDGAVPPDAILTAPPNCFASSDWRCITTATTKFPAQWAVSRSINGCGFGWTPAGQIP